MPAEVLVTGATGFIGSHLVERLAQAGWEVRCLVRRTSSLRYLPVNAVRIVEGDLATGAGLAKACAGTAVVFHLAGVTKARNAAEYDTGNRTATAQVVKACVAAGVPRLVHVSSLAAAGPSPNGIPLDEEAPCRPVSQYGKSKLAGECAVRDSGIGERATIVRPPVVYGPRDTDVLHVFRAAARGWIASIGRGERFFSSIYVKDLVTGLIAAGQCPASAGRTYFLTDSKPLSWNEFGTAAAQICGRTARSVAVPPLAAWIVGAGAEAWSRVTGRRGIISRDKIREACCSYWTCSSARAARELRFRAATSLHDGMAETIAWYRQTGWM